MTIIDDILVYHDPIAICALVVSIVAIFFSFLQYLLQRKQWLQSVKPFGNIEIHDMPDEISIKICNSGLGTMRFVSMVTENKQGEKKEHPADWIHKELAAQGKTLTSKGIFKSYRKGHHIKAGSDEAIVHYDFSSSNNDDYRIKKDERTLIRGILKDLTIHIKYTDIFDNEQPEINEPLEGFGET